jgi:hypothetical protein
MGAPSLIYRSPLAYEMLMLALYGRHYPARMRSIAAQVPTGASVLECCCGPAALYRRHLHGLHGCVGQESMLASLTWPLIGRRYRGLTSRSSRRASTTSCPTRVA